jgi:hypothetical protein
MMKEKQQLANSQTHKSQKLRMKCRPHRFLCLFFFILLFFFFFCLRRLSLFRDYSPTNFLLALNIMSKRDSSYDKTVKSKLSFKGTRKIKKRRKTEEKSSDIPTTEDNQSDKIIIVPGSGRMTSSGNTIQGHETKFEEELSPGDAIIVFHPQSLRDETKIVRMVLSNVSIGISSAFSSDLVSTTPFKFIKAPKEELSAAALEEINDKKIRKRDDMERDAFGTYASAGGEKFVYRVRNKSAYGGYKIVTEAVKKGEEASRESFLIKRSKHKADRHC